ncbi:hypothetical protein FRC11_003061, partial [Ceratobasidium sp. 423]
MPEDNLIDEIISSQPAVDEDEEEEEEDMGSEAMGEDNTPCCIRALRLLAEAGTSVHELLDDVLLGPRPKASRRGAIKLIQERRAYSSPLSYPPATRRNEDPWEKWVNDTTVDVLQLELAKQAKSMRAADVESEVVNEESLKELTFDSILEEVQKNTPMLFNTLTRICATAGKDKNEQRDSKFSVTLLINALSYQLSLKSNRMQKLICIYLKAKGIPKSCYFFLQRTGLSLSYEWS